MASTSSPSQPASAESALPRPAVGVSEEASVVLVNNIVKRTKGSKWEIQDPQPYATENRTIGDCDIDQALSAHVEGVQIPVGSDLDLLGGIGHNSTRGPPPALDETIARLEQDVRQTSDDNPDRARLLEHLGLALQSRFDHLGDIRDLEKAIAMHGEAVKLLPHPHPDRASCLANLGSTFRDRFDTLGHTHDLDEAVASYQEAVLLTSHDDPSRATCMESLAIALSDRFERFGDLCDIDESITRLEEAVELTSNDDPDRAGRLIDLGISFRFRFNRLGHLEDLEQAIARAEEAVRLTPGADPNRAGRLAYFGMFSGIRFRRLGNYDDLEQAIAKLEEAVHLTPCDHPARAHRLVNLGVALRSRFDRLGDVDDLERSIAGSGEAVRLTRGDHPSRADAVANLGISFGTRFNRFSDVSDLEQAITLQEEAVRLTPHNHPGRAGHLVDLGLSLQLRFYRLGDPDDLEQAIASKEEAIRLTPDDHPDRVHRIASLGHAFGDRFKRFGDIRDLDQATLLLKESAQLTPSDDPDLATRFFNVGAISNIRFGHFGDLGDLDQEIGMKGEAVRLIPHNHPAYPWYQASLGLAFYTRFIYLVDARDLEQAIERQQESIQLTPGDHPDRAYYLGILGNSLGVRFCHFGEVQDLDQAIARQTEAVQLSPGDHPGRAHRQFDLARSFQIRFDSLGDRSALNDALFHFSFVARSPTCSSSLRFSASKQWISCARSLEHDSLLDAYAVAVQLLPQLAWIGFTLQNRYQELRRGADVVREAASVALEFGHPDLAVEWLEQGRFIVWNDILQLRSPLDELRSEHPAIAAKLCQVSNTLERASARDQPMIGSVSETAVTDGLQSSLEEQARQHRALAVERDKLLAKVRSLPGFERFLLGKTITQLKTLVYPGPVVILNASERHCDALVIRADVDNVLHVPLPGITLTHLESLQMTLEKVLRCAGGRDLSVPSPGLQPPLSDLTSTPRDDLEESLDLLMNLDIHLDGTDTSAARLARPRTSDGILEQILSLLWTDIVKPIIEALGFSTPGQLRRIFWCPTGPFAFLPIHAAGLYDTTEPGSRLSDLAISSYTPTLGALAPMREPNAEPATHVRLLIVSQPDTNGPNPLPGTHEEMKYIKTAIDNASSAHISLVESNGTVEDVLDKMTESEWVHFACHGIQDLGRPVDSGLVLADHRRLKLSDIIKLSRPRGGLAFLSACQTASGDKRLSEEAVHLAAGTLLAGYSSVIATMWQIGDRDAPEVARDVYGELLRDASEKAPDSCLSARALHVAVRRLCERGAPFLSWVPFIHIGL